MVCFVQPSITSAKDSAWHSGGAKLIFVESVFSMMYFYQGNHILEIFFRVSFRYPAPWLSLVQLYLSCICSSDLENMDTHEKASFSFSKTFAMPAGVFGRKVGRECGFLESTPFLGWRPQPLPFAWLAAHMVSAGQPLCLVLCPRNIQTSGIVAESGKY